MNKKQIYIILGTIVFFIIIIAIILSSNKKTNWQKEILSAKSVDVAMENCNNRKTKLPKDITKTIFNKWNNLIDNGPWTGEENKCYNELTITYEKDGIVQSVKILLVGNSSLVLDIGGAKRYYVNSEEINKYLNQLFETY